MDNEIEVILWDIGNVLLKTISNSLIEVIYEKRKIDISRESYNNIIFSILNKSFVGKISLEQTWMELMEVVQIKNANEINEIKNSIMVNRNEELITFIKKLSKKGFKMGVVSDLSQISYHVVKNRCRDILDLCMKDMVFISVDYGCTKVKDGNRWFNQVKEKLNIDADKIIFIDDDEKIIDVARQHGIRAIHYSKNKLSDNWSTQNKKLFDQMSAYGIG